MTDIAAATAGRTVLQSCLLLVHWLRTGTLAGHLRAWWRLRRAARLLHASPAFDAHWYRAMYPDVAATRADPALHYLRRGAAEGRAPLPIANPALPHLALNDANYRTWIAAHDTPRADHLAGTRRAIDGLAWRPVIGVVVLRGGHVDEQATVGSLKEQLYPDWCLTEAPNGDVMLFLPAGTLLAPTALFQIAAAVAAAPSIELIYADEDRLDPAGGRIKPWFKPPWDPVLAHECDLLSVTGAYRRRLLDRLGTTRVTNREALGEFARRAANAVAPEAIRHIPAVLFQLPQTEAPPGVAPAPPLCASHSSPSLPSAHSAHSPSSQHSPSWPVGLALGRLTRGLTRPSAHRRCRTDGPANPRDKRAGAGSTDHHGESSTGSHQPLVTIIIPTRDHAALLARCINGILHRTDYHPVELLIINNDSRAPRTTRLLSHLANDPRIRILPHPGPFNWSAMNNAAVSKARGEIIVLLNNDTDVINPGWLHEMVTLAQQPDIGIVGARLLYPNGTLQHAGMTIGPGAVTAHLNRGAARDDPGHGGMLRHTRSVAAVTGACMVMRRAVFEAVGGLETEHLAVTNNDLDLCLRVRARGWRVVCTPRAELYHLDAASRGSDLSAKQIARVQQERAYLVQRWGALAQHDPYLSPNLAVVNGQLALAVPATLPRRAIAIERRIDALEVGQQIGRQSGGRQRGAADIQRVG